jgi:hypothetical protein
MKLFVGLLDRILFALGLLLALQIPQFLDHYTQRYAGYRDAVADSVADYQRTADAHYDGNLDRLVDDLRAAPGGGVQEIGDKLQRDRDKLTEMDANLLVLRGDSLWAKLRYLAVDVDRPLARGALEDFKPGLPLTTDALICGAIGALLLSGLFNALVWLVALPWRRRYRPAL